MDQDAFGAPHDPRWFVNEDFWQAVAPVLFGAADTKSAKSEALALAQAMDVTPGSSILDVFCGPGRLAQPLADLGYGVLGVDRTERYLQAAREAERTRSRPPRLVSASAVVPPTESAGSGPTGSATYHRAELGSDEGGFAAEVPIASVDAAIWAGLSTGYAGVEFDRAVLEWIRLRLRPDSPLLIEVSTLEDLRDPGFEAVEWFEDRRPDEVEADAVWRLRHSLIESEDEEWFEGAWTRFVLGAVDEFRFGYQIHARDRWVQMLGDAGFVAVRFEDDLNGFRPDRRVVKSSRERAQSWIRAKTPL